MSIFLKVYTKTVPIKQKLSKTQFKNVKTCGSKRHLHYAQSCILTYANFKLLITRYAKGTNNNNYY
jgi:hypothetical protein